MRLGAAARISLASPAGRRVCRRGAFSNRRRSAWKPAFEAAWRLGACTSTCRRRFSGYCWCRSGCNGAGLSPTLVSLWRPACVLLLPVWLALVQLRQAGPLALLAIMAVVWLADIGAYFAGRSLGKHKLAPSISPGKTWEGAIGGGVAVLVYGLLLSSRLPAILAGNLPLLLVVLVLLTAISILGDLFESLLKRQAGLKDSSKVLPGHGGVLDRIDSLTSTLPLVALVWLVTRL
jgi:CDP-diglyceride synthetase